MFGRKSTTKSLARAEKKAVKKANKTADKTAKRTDSKTAKAVKKAQKEEPKGLVGTLTDPKTAKRALAVARIAGPAVAPFALKAATSTREFLDQRRAVKLGVTADEVSAFRGPTGPAGARIAGLKAGVEELRARRTTDLQAVRFADVARTRLVDLSTAVNTAASMPPARRRGTLAAVNKELNQIEADLMTYLVGSPV